MTASTVYSGPVCYVGHDHEAADGHELKGGWHYTVVEGPDGYDMPGEPLYLDETTDAYRLAQDDDVSWRDRHHKQLVIVAPGGGVGVPRTDEEFEATHRHLDDLEERITNGRGLDPHEHDHILRTPAEIDVVRGWLNQTRPPQ